MADNSPYRVHPEGTHWAPYMYTGGDGMVTVPTVKRMDILDVTQGLTVQQINPHVMGAGLALLYKKRYPQIYLDFLEAKVQGLLNLGYVIFSKIDHRLTVASYVGQVTYGRGGNHTMISAVDDALFQIEVYVHKKEIKQVYIPWMMGCGLAGGDWDDIAPIIGNRLPNCVICKLGAD